MDAMGRTSEESVWGVDSDKGSMESGLLIGASDGVGPIAGVANGLTSWRGQYGNIGTVDGVVVEGGSTAGNRDDLPDEEYVS